jgi:hypothetical protein
VAGGALITRDIQRDAERINRLCVWVGDLARFEV